jgi:hypothetical protein
LAAAVSSIMRSMLGVLEAHQFFGGGAAAPAPAWRAPCLVHRTVVLAGVLQQLFRVFDHLPQVVDQSLLGLAAGFFGTVHDVPPHK